MNFFFNIELLACETKHQVVPSETVNDVVNENLEKRKEPLKTAATTSSDQNSVKQTETQIQMQ